MIKKIIYKIKRRWAHSSSDRMISYLRKKGMKIGERVTLFQVRDIVIDITRPSLVEIGDDVALTKGFTLLTHGYDWMVLRNLYGELIPSSGKVIIGNNVFIGFNVTVLKGVEIGQNSIIGAGSLVTKSIPPNSVAAGNPAKVICTIEEYRNKRKRECLGEAIEYAKSIPKAFNREAKIEDFWEEFPLFMDGDTLDDKLPIKNQLGHMYDSYRQNNKALFCGFEEFIKEANKR